MYIPFEQGSVLLALDRNQRLIFHSLFPKSELQNYTHLIFVLNAHLWHTQEQDSLFISTKMKKGKKMSVKKKKERNISFYMNK